jgi:hypothetical protein
MTRRTGSADLPLHRGRLPHWLGSRTARWELSPPKPLFTNTDATNFCAGPPFWFQSFGAVMGMDLAVLRHKLRASLAH